MHRREAQTRSEVALDKWRKDLPNGEFFEIIHRVRRALAHRRTKRKLNVKYGGKKVNMNFTPAEQQKLNAFITKHQQLRKEGKTPPASEVAQIKNLLEAARKRGSGQSGSRSRSGPQPGLSVSHGGKKLSLSFTPAERQKLNNFITKHQQMKQQGKTPPASEVAEVKRLLDAARKRAGGKMDLSTKLTTQLEQLMSSTVVSREKRGTDHFREKRSIKGRTLFRADGRTNLRAAPTDTEVNSRSDAEFLSIPDDSVELTDRHSGSEKDKMEEVALRAADSSLNMKDDASFRSSRGSNTGSGANHDRDGMTERSGDEGLNTADKLKLKRVMQEVFARRRRDGITGKVQMTPEEKGKIRRIYLAAGRRILHLMTEKHRRMTRVVDVTKVTR